MITFWYKDVALLSFDENPIATLRKDDDVFLEHMGLPFSEIGREDIFPSSRWKVQNVHHSVRSMDMRVDPTPEWPMTTKTVTFLSCDVHVRPYRYWTIGISAPRKGKFFCQEYDGRFFRIGRIYIGLGYTTYGKSRERMTSL